MAHNLATINGRTAMAYQNETPWHKLGFRLRSMTSVAQAMEAASLDYLVEEAPMYLADGTPVPMRKAILRRESGESRIIATVGKGYEILQHTEGFNELDVLCTEHGMTIESAGALGEGERVWMLFKMPDTVTPIPGDDIRGYLLATTGHDGIHSYQLRPTPIRVVCQNTLDASSMNGGTDFVRLFHTKRNGDKLSTAARIVEKIVASFKETGETFASFAARQMSDKEVIKFIETLFPEKDKPSKVLDQRRATVADLVWTGVGSDIARSTTKGQPNAWAVYNAVTEYFDHVRPAEAKSKTAKLSANEAAIFGHSADVKARAMKLAQQLVAA